jgi:putative membrane protein
MSSVCRPADRRRHRKLAAAAPIVAALAWPFPAQAHSPPAPTRGDFWASWNLDWAALAYIALAALVYAIGWRAGRRSHSPAAGPWRAACFAAGLIVVCVAIVSPLDALAHSLFSAHMAQHMLLIAVAAPLIVLARPVSVLARGAPRTLTRLVARLARPLRRGCRRLAPAAWALAVLGVHVGAVWVWHVPPVYAVTLASPAAHAVAHATLLATALLFWGCLIASGRAAGVGRGAAIAIAFGAAAGTGVLGALLTFTATALYPEHGAPAAEWGMTALADQQLGGLLMWVPGGTVYLIAAVVLVIRLLDGAEDVARPSVPGTPRGVGGT